MCGCELVEAYLFGKNSDEYSVEFRSFARVGFDFLFYQNYNQQ